ncbi:hypothetical protein Peur_028137 [Populus x canadensis]
MEATTKAAQEDSAYELKRLDTILALTFSKALTTAVKFSYRGRVEVVVEEAEEDNDEERDELVPVPNRGEGANDDDVVVPNKMEPMFDVEGEPGVELLEEKTVFQVKVKRVDAGEQDYIGMVCVAIPKAIPVART